MAPTAPAETHLTLNATDPAPASASSGSHAGGGGGVVQGWALLWLGFLAACSQQRRLRSQVRR